ncbi:MAG: lamin tail domain-containing protein, partial [Candidatus Poseidoniales archaeon]|nr:lamin tail domain-containing protein [Candidatus Poseidoniales archaeon]
RSTACSGSICLSELHVNAAGAAETSAVGPSDWTTGEWVEIYNSGTSSVDLSGWSVADHYSRGMNFSTSTIVWPTNPSNAVIGAGAYMVIARNGDGQSCGFCMTNSAGVVELVDGSSTQVHSGTWSSYSAEGKTRIEKPGDPAADWIESNGLTAGQPNSGGSTGPTWSTSDLRISELLPDAWPSYDNDTYPGGEWLEIENTGSAAIDLTNWSVEDSTGNTLQINATHLIGAAQSMSIEAGAFRVVAVNGARTYGLFNNAAGSESAFLINPDGDFVSGANYTGPTRMGHAYIAPMIGSGDWVTALWPTPGAPNAVLINATSEVQINEVMVNSTATGGGYPNGEWVELYHAGSGSSINLSGWKMFSGTGQSVNVTDLIVDRSSGAGSLIAVDEYIVVDFPPSTAMLVINGDQLSLVNSQGGITQTVEWGANPGQNKSIIPYDPEDVTQPWIVSGWQTPAAPNPNQLTGSVNASTDLRISEIMGNPSGSDSNTYPEGEWVELVNIGNDTLSFEDWRLKDGRNVSLHFNANSIPGLDEVDPLAWELAAGEFVVVWRNGSGMSLQNGGDLLSLVNPDGEVTHQVTWDITPMNGTVVQGVAIEDDWVPSPHPTPGAPNPAFTQPYTGSTSVEISEVMAQCTAGTLTLDGDWLELHNTGLTEVNISRWL